MLKTYQAHRNISVPEPCHEDWGKMPPEEQGRFCDSCCKVVTDFSNKTPLEIQKILQEKAGEKVCGHFRTDQVNKVPFEIVAFRKRHWSKMLARTFLLAAFFSFGASLFSCTSSEGRVVKTQPELIEVLYPNAPSVEMMKVLAEGAIPTRQMIDYVNLQLIPEPPEILPPTIEGGMVMGYEAPIPFDFPPPPDEVPEDNTNYTIVDNMPEFSGGERGMFGYLAKSVHYPLLARENGVEGTVYVEFTVNRDGEVENANVVRGVGYGCDKAALYAINNMPRWEPGRQRGINVNVRMVVPIKFTLR